MYKQKLKQCIFLMIFLVLTPLISAAHQLPTDLVNETTGLMSGLAYWANNVTFGWFWTALLATFCLVLYISASRYTTERAFAYAGITGLFGSIFLITLNLMDWKVGTIFIIAGILGIVWLVVKRD